MFCVGNLIQSNLFLIGFQSFSDFSALEIIIDVSTSKVIFALPLQTYYGFILMLCLPAFSCWLLRFAYSKGA